MLSKKELLGDLSAISIQNERRKRKFDSKKSTPMISIVARTRHAADFCDSIDPKLTLMSAIGRAQMVIDRYPGLRRM